MTGLWVEFCEHKHLKLLYNKKSLKFKDEVELFKIMKCQICLKLCY